jgi:tetratricopeptide (TPR) repeat protein
VWYDEHNLGSGQLMAVIQRELGRRPVVVVILSKAAFATTWVNHEVTWAFELQVRDLSRLILPVTAGPIERSDFDPERGWLFLHGFKRIEAPDMQPYPTPEAVQRLLEALGLKAGPPPIDLLALGQALLAQGKAAKALPLLERATQLAPRSYTAWATLGRALNNRYQYGPAVEAYDRALALNSRQVWVWSNKSLALQLLYRYDEALAAAEHAITLDPTYAPAWCNKGWALSGTRRSNKKLYEEMLAAFEQATTLDPTYAPAWHGTGMMLQALKRYEEALAAFEQAIALDPDDSYAWSGKQSTLLWLGRTTEAQAAQQRAKELHGQGRKYIMV